VLLTTKRQMHADLMLLLIFSLLLPLLLLPCLALPQARTRSVCSVWMLLRRLRPAMMSGGCRMHVAWPAWKL
jgi:hypothetical protein